MRTPDIRWEQRFNNYKKAFSKLDEAVKRISLDFEMDIYHPEFSLFRDKMKALLSGPQ